MEPELHRKGLGRKKVIVAYVKGNREKSEVFKVL
jgi:hypothetical protein